MMTEKQIIDKYLGVPFRHQGRTMSGLDCWGFLKMAYADLGYDLLDVEADYDEDWSWKDKNYFIENYWREWDVVPYGKFKPFDGILFNNSRGRANHAGMVISNNRFIHCCKHGTIISRIWDPQWSKRINGFYRLKAMQND